VLARTQQVMGTVVSIQAAPGELPASDVRAALEGAFLHFVELDAIFSTWKPESPLSRLRAGALGVEDAPPVIHVVTELCRRARELTGRRFDPWAMPGGFDPTGLVKGWAAEEALGLLAGAGIRSAMVNAGGDVAVMGSPELDAGGTGAAAGVDVWRIGIAHPWRPGALACVAGVTSAVATSGTYERAGHLVDPSGRSPSFAASATVTGENLWLCDAMATALAVAVDEGLEFIEPVQGYEAYLIRCDGSETATDGFPFVKAQPDPEPDRTPAGDGHRGRGSGRGRLVRQ
jgi:thiamine biosynthesis lipoprotein